MFQTTNQIHIYSILFPFINEGQLLTTGSNWDPPSDPTAEMHCVRFCQLFSWAQFQMPKKGLWIYPPGYEQMLLPSNTFVFYLFDHFFPVIQLKVCISYLVSNITIIQISSSNDHIVADKYTTMVTITSQTLYYHIDSIDISDIINMQIYNSSTP